MKNNNRLSKRISSFIMRLALSGTSLLALAVVTANINAACTFLVHQPELPENAKKLRKF